MPGTYDFVGFDPRGTGQSDPLTCLDTADLDALNAFDPTPDSPAERQQGIDLVDGAGRRRARQNSGLLADHVTTIETARDIDVLRAVMGDDKLDYFGFSYGTFLGTTYAALFPDKVDRFVLDGAVAPGLNRSRRRRSRRRDSRRRLRRTSRTASSTHRCARLEPVRTQATNALRQLLSISTTTRCRPAIRHGR